MEIILSWLANHWDKFSLWVTNQPGFVEVAFGVGLFYTGLLVTRAAWKTVVFILAGLFSIPGRFRKQKDLRARIPSRKAVAAAEDTPFSVFR